MNKRQKEVMQTQLNNEKAVLKKLESNYEDALAEINSKIEILLSRQDADMQHVIYQVEYQKALKKQVQSILETLQTNEFETISEYLTNAYEGGFLGTMYDLHGQGIPLIFPIDQEQVVAAVQHETKLSEDLYTALGKDVTDLRKKIAGEISRGISTGMMYSEIARNVSGYARIPKNNAMRIARTEAHRIQCKAAMDAQYKAKSKGADIVKQWDAALDSRTRDSHREVDGEFAELDDTFSNGLKYPGDPSGRAGEVINCRCALLQRARWALGNDYTKWSEDAPVMIDDEGTTQFAIIDAKNYKDFQKQYKQASEQVRDSVQMMDEGTSQEKAKIDFTPAKSIEEAQEAAKQYIGSGYSKTFKNEADFKGISLENANEINRTLGELYAQYDMPKINGIKAISPTSAQGKKVFSDADAVAAYNPVEHGLFLNKNVLKNANAIEEYNKQSAEAWDIVMQNIDKLSDSQKELALLYKNAGRALVGDGTVHDYIVHEMGHHVQWQVLDTATNNAMGKTMGKYAPGISGYANASKGEYIAESYAAYVKGEIEKLDPVFVDYMKKGIVKNSNSDIIKTSVEYVKKNTSVLPTVQLPKKEYAHVMSEINTHMSDEQRELPIVSKAIGDYIYTFENHGFNEYRIIGKVPIESEKYDEIERIFDEIE